VNRVLVILIVAFAALAPLRAQDFANDLEEAKALYREGRFGQTIARLQTLILRLQSDEGSLSPAIEAEAHLVTALAYIALDDRDAAKAAFGQLLRLEPERRLDPEVHAPKVIALFEEARRTLPAGRERSDRPLASGSATTSTAPPSVESPSRLPWLVVGGAAGAGTAVASGSSRATPTTAPFTTTVPASVEIDARMNEVKQGTFSCSQGIFLTVDVINHSTTLVGVDGFDITLNTISAACINHRPAIDGTVGVDVLPGARVQIRRADLGGDLRPPAGPGWWRAVVVVVTSRGRSDRRVNTIP
jgi:hypothetical protein